MNTRSELPKDIDFLCQWTHDFDKLLSDKYALKLFAEFLKKEYSYENLRFWMSCRRYKKIRETEERIQYSKHIYDKYLRTGAPEAVNVDNQALISVESGLENPKPDLFAVPEKQIYDLMKFDCYKRFLKSFYSNNVLESAFHEKILENINKIRANDRQNQLTISRYRKNAFKKLKKVEINEINKKIAKRKLIKNLSPKKKLINGSKDENYLNKRSNECHPMKCERMQRSTQMESIQWMQMNIFSPKPKPKPNQLNSSHFEEQNIHHLTVVFSDDSQEIVYLEKSQTINYLLEKLLTKRNLNFTSFEAFPFGSKKELDLNSDVMKLSYRRIRVEQRVVFELLLPNGVTVNVKTRPSLMSAKVLNPILIEFNPKYDPEYYEIKFVDTSESLSADVPIFCADNRKLIVIYKGINENKCIESKSIAESNPSMFAIKDKQFLNEFLEKELFNENRNNSNFLDFSDLSFSDDNKSEAFFNDLMKCSQTVPMDENEFKLSPKVNIEKHIMFSENNDFKDIEKLKENISQNFQKTINSPKFKLIDSKSKSSPTLKSDQLYDRRYVQRVDKLIPSKDKNSKNKSCEKLGQSSASKQISNSIQTLSKFHKTSGEKLLMQPKNEMSFKLIVPNFLTQIK